MNQSLITLMNKLPEGVDAAIIISDENRRYLTNMKSSAGTLVVTAKKAYFIIDFRYIEKAKTIITDFDVILQENDIFSQIDGILKENAVKTVAVESASMTVSQFQKFISKLPNYEFSNSNTISNLVSDLRSVKNDEEIVFMKNAQAITDKAFLHILDFIKPGMTEVEIALELEYTMKKLGASNLAFDSIVVSGTNSSLPHGVPSMKKIELGDFITMDFGAAYNGYCSDMTRTIAIGKISDEQRKVYDTVLTSQLMALDAICAGKKYSDIDKIARDYIYSQGYEGCFGHGLGHSLGLNIHEEPRFSSLCDEITAVDTIMTVEPGVYLSGKFGVRIEDMVVIKENGCVNITKSEKNLITL
jgi:Xaa-Pro aminopeptidase